MDLIYIDPPFATGQDFSVQLEIGDEWITKEPSLIEEKAYRDTWGRGWASYLQLIYERIVLARMLLAPTGSMYVHIGPQVNHMVRCVLDEVFGIEYCQREIIWKRVSSRSHGKYYPATHDAILFYSRSVQLTWNQLFEPLDQEYVDSKYRFRDPDGRRYQKDNCLNQNPNRPNLRYEWNGHTRTWRWTKEKIQELHAAGRLIYTKSGIPEYKRYLDESEGVALQSIWTDIRPINSQASEDTGYDTQKPSSLLERIITASSKEGDLILDFFCGSGTTMAVAERLKRRWIGCDVSRWGIQVSRKRLLDADGCKPFEVLNLGKYERQYWQGVMFNKGRGEQKALHEYVRFVLDLYHAEGISGLSHIHGQRGGFMIHVGAADSPVTLAEIREAVDECKKISQSKLDILGWEWEMGLHDVVEAESKRAGVKLRLLLIPRECMDQRAVDAGDVHFYELAYLQVESERRSGSKEIRIKLKNFVIPNPDLIPDDLRNKIKKWSDFIDYWSVDFEFNEDVFHNLWQDYRTRSKRDLELVSDWHEYGKGGSYKVLVKVFDIFGNDTTQLLEVRV